MTFLLGGRLSSPCCSSKEVTFSYTEQTRSILSPHDIWVWGSMKEVMLMGSLARAGVLCSNPSWLSPAQTHNSHLHSLILQGLWRTRGHCCHCFLKMVDPTAAWAQPCSSAQFVDKEHGANSVPSGLDRSCVQVVSWLKVLVV